MFYHLQEKYAARGFIVLPDGAGWKSASLDSNPAVFRLYANKYTV
jgi:hypothetical protein